MVAYILGLIVTIFVMYHFKAAQPALLYLSPACIGASFLTSLVLGDVKPLLDYKEEDKKKEGEGQIKSPSTKKKE